MERKPVQTLRRDQPPPTKTEPERQLGGPQSGWPPPFIVGQDLAPYLIAGIDFGSNFCRVSTFAGGEPHNLQPGTFSSLVEDILSVSKDSSQLVYSIKRCISDDLLVKCGNMTYSGADLTCLLLRKVRKKIEDSVNRLLAKAVIAVPACFDHRQRQDVLSGAKEAEVAVLGLINEPTAAALHVCSTRKLRNGRYLVISSGSYSFEASVVELQNRLIETKAVRGAQIYSGHAITFGMAVAIRDEFQLKDLDALVIAADGAKRQLDTKGVAVIEAEERKISLGRSTVAHYLSKFTEGIESFLMALLSDSGTDPAGISGVILTGLSTKSWLLKDLLKRSFADPALHTGDVAAGAAIYAALLVRQAKDWVIWDAIANPVSVFHGGHVVEVIATNSPLPINGHALLHPEDSGKARGLVLQRETDRDGDIVQVATVSVVEELPSGEDLASVDLSISATGDGTLSFAARHKTLDVNLTVEVSHPSKDQRTVIDITQEPARESSTKDRFEPGIALEQIGDKWLVNCVVEASPAWDAGIQVYDELCTVNNRSVQDSGEDVIEQLYGQMDESKDLKLKRGSSTISVTVKCTLPIERWTIDKLNSAIADANITGNNRKLVDALLNYAHYETIMLQDGNRERARQAIERAIGVASLESPPDQLLLLRALCAKCNLVIYLALDERSDRDALISELEQCYGGIVDVARHARELTLAAAQLFSDLAASLAELCTVVDCKSKVAELTAHALAIGIDHQVPEEVLERMKRQLTLGN